MILICRFWCHVFRTNYFSRFQRRRRRVGRVRNLNNLYLLLNFLPEVSRQRNNNDDGIIIINRTFYPHNYIYLERVRMPRQNHYSYLYVRIFVNKIFILRFAILAVRTIKTRDDHNIIGEHYLYSSMWSKRAPSMSRMILSREGNCCNGS